MVYHTVCMNYEMLQYINIIGRISKWQEAQVERATQGAGEQQTARLMELPEEGLERKRHQDLPTYTLIYIL